MFFQEQKGRKKVKSTRIASFDLESGSSKFIWISFYGVADCGFHTDIIWVLQISNTKIKIEKTNGGGGKIHEC